MLEITNMKVSEVHGKCVPHSDEQNITWVT